MISKSLICTFLGLFSLSLVVANPLDEVNDIVTIFKKIRKNNVDDYYERFESDWKKLREQVKELTENSFDEAFRECTSDLALLSEEKLNELRHEYNDLVKYMQSTLKDWEKLNIYLINAREKGGKTYEEAKHNADLWRELSHWKSLSITMKLITHFLKYLDEVGVSETKCLQNHELFYQRKFDDEVDGFYEQFRKVFEDFRKEVERLSHTSFDEMLKMCEDYLVLLSRRKYNYLRNEYYEMIKYQQNTLKGYEKLDSYLLESREKGMEAYEKAKSTTDKYMRESSSILKSKWAMLREHLEKALDSVGGLSCMKDYPEIKFFSAKEKI